MQYFLNAGICFAIAGLYYKFIELSLVVGYREREQTNYIVAGILVAMGIWQSVAGFIQVW